MKKITPLKSLSLLITLFCAVNLGFGQTTLSAGDIAITGFNSDDPDEFSFVLLTDISNTTTIKFTDNGWQNTGSFRANEGIITWNATSDLYCGAEITILYNTAGNTYSASSGSAVETTGDFSLSTNGDQILAYQGADANPTFIYAINFNGTGWSDATSSNDTALPTGLTDTTNAVNFGEIDNATYDCNVTSDTSLILAGISNSSNWILDNNSISSIGGCYYSCAACTGGTVTWTSGAWSPLSGPTEFTQVIIAEDYDTSNGVTEISFSACSLKVNIGASLTIADNTYVEVQNDLTVDGTITVQPTGAFIQNDDLGKVTNNSTITVEKETAPLDYWYEYTYWSSPVSDATIGVALSASDAGRRFSFNASQFNDELMETGNNNTFVAGQDGIDDEGNDWQWVNGTTPMQPGKGYAATHSLIAMAPFPGIRYKYIFQALPGEKFNNGVINVTVDRNDDDITNADDNPNLIGNPYPSAIDINAFLTENMYDATTNPTGTLEGVIYFWSQNTNYSATENGNQAYNFNTTDYAYYNGTAWTIGGDGLTPNGFIPSGQGFFVNYHDSAPSPSGTVVFNNAMRSITLSPDNSQFFKNSNSKKQTTNNLNKLWVDLTSDNGVFNQIAIGYVNGATNNDDGSYYDARKIVAPNAFAALFSTIDNLDKKYVIQGKDINSINEDEIIKLGFKTTIEVPTIFKLSIAQLEGDFLSNSPVYLKDNLLNKLHDLTTSDYTFTSEVGEFNDRFEIVFNSAALSTTDVALNSKSLRIIELEDDSVQFTASDNLSIKTVTIFDLLGRPLYSFKGNNASETYTLSNLHSSIYIAKVALSNGVVVTKKAIKK